MPEAVEFCNDGSPHNRAAPGAIEREVVRPYDEHSASLFRYALVLAANRESAEDAVQKAFLRYFIARDEGRVPEQPKPWLLKVVRNYLLDALKASSVRKEVSLDQVRESPGGRQDTESEYRGAELARDLWKMSSPRECECLRPRVEGLRYDEVAAVISPRLGTMHILVCFLSCVLWKTPARWHQPAHRAPVDLAPTGRPEVCLPRCKKRAM